MSVFLLLHRYDAEHVIDGGTVRSVCQCGADLVDALRSADRAEVPGSAPNTITLEAEAVRGGWIVCWPHGDPRARSVLVRDDEDSGERLWAQLCERPPSLTGIVERVDALAYGGAASESVSFELGGDRIEVNRGHLRIAGSVLRGLKHFGRLVSITPKPRGPS